MGKIKKILVTGNEGYIGSVLTGVLAEAGYSVRGLDWGVFKDAEFVPRQTASVAEQIYKDVRAVAPEDLKGIDAVIHLAAISNDPTGDLNPRATYSINHEASVRLAKLAKSAGVSRFLFASSCSVYGASGGSSMASEESELSPQSHYAKSKIMAERDISALAGNNFCPIFLRNATVFGSSPRMRLDLVVQGLLSYAYLYGAIKILSDGLPWRPVVHIRDVSEAFLFFLKAPSKKVCGQAFNIGNTENNLQIKQIAEVIQRIMPQLSIDIKNEILSDKRSYKVDFSKIYSLGFKPKYSVADGAEEIYKIFKKTDFSEEDFNSDKYNTLKRYQKLINEGKMNKNLEIEPHGRMGKLEEFFKRKRVLVTGHTGFKGAWLTKILADWGASVIGVSLDPATNPNLFEVLGLKKQIKDYRLDIRDSKKLEEVFFKEKPEIVFHLAAQPIVRASYDDPLNTISTNTLGTSNVLEAIKNSGQVRAAVIITTDKVYENKERERPYKENDRLGGHDLYSASKAAADIIANAYRRSYGLPLAIARAGNVIGGGDWSTDRLVPDIMRAVYENKKKIVIRNPGAVRPWQHVLEPLCGYLLLAQALYEKKSQAVGAWNFGPKRGEAISVEDLLKSATAICGCGEYEIIPDLEKPEARILKLDVSKAQRLLGWQSRFSVHDAVNSTVFWYKTYYEGGDVPGVTEQQIRSFFS